MPGLPLLHHDDFVFCSLKGLVWVSNGLGLPTALQANAGRALTLVIGNIEPQKPLIIDCRGILTVDDHALESARVLIESQARALLFLNADSIEASLKSELGEYSLLRIGRMPVVIFGDDSFDARFISGLIEQSSTVLSRYFNEAVKGSFQKYESGPRRMASTPLIASGVFDARSLISDPQKFVWTSLLMAEALENFLDTPVNADSMPDRFQKPLRQFRLLAVSLRGSPLAAAVGLLTRRHKAVEIVDHMGPKYKILEEPSLRSTGVDDDYIYVGDFVVGGTELRIAQAYSRGKGTNIRHAVVIGSMLSSEDYNLDFGITSLVKLRDVCPNEKFIFLEN